MRMDSPAFRTQEPSLTSHEAMLDFLASRASDGGGRMQLGSLGRSAEHRDVDRTGLESLGAAGPEAAAAGPC